MVCDGDDGSACGKRGPTHSLSRPRKGLVKDV